MFLQISINHPSDDFLKMQSWDFILLDNLLVLERYAELSKKTKRHKYNVDKIYKRLCSRNNNISLADVPFDEKIQVEAMQELVRKITVTKERP